MMSCRIVGCREGADGQMVACSPHWSLLPEQLRLDLRDAWDAVREAEGFQRPIVAPLEHWHRLLGQADTEWAAIRSKLRRRLLKLAPASRQDGRVWARELRELGPQSTEAPSG